MTYSVKEIYYTLQGEGFYSGRPAVFCRFSGCNLWSGREQDRSEAICNFCDTDFIGTDGPGGGKFSNAKLLAQKIRALWPDDLSNPPPFVVLTGGEPALQIDEALTDALHQFGFEIAVETNGTIELCPGIDWICVSPKADTHLAVLQGHELKLVYPQVNNKPEDFSSLDFNYFFLQPLDNGHRTNNTLACIEYCKQHPLWQLSLQTHKLIGIP